MLEKILIGGQNPGLCDRLTNLLLACKIGDYCHRKVYFKWPVNNACGAEFRHLFRIRPDFTNIQVSSETPDIPAHVTSHELGRFKRGGAWIIEEAIAQETVSTLILPSRYFGHNYDDLNKVLEPNDELASLIDNYYNNQWHSSTVGVHIRRTDKVREGAPDLKLYMDAIDDLLESQSTLSFFVASDDPQSLYELHNRYGNRVFRYPVRNLQRNSLEGIQDAVITLYLLRRCLGVIGSDISGYSLCAGWDRPFTNISSSHSKNRTWTLARFNFISLKNFLASDSNLVL